MRNEIYVVWLVKTSERARAVVSEAVGDLALPDLLRRLDRFDQTEERYAEYAARIRAEFTPPRLPAVFTAQHVRLLVDAKVQTVLAADLQCKPADLISTLLDAQQLSRALREAGQIRDGAGDAEAFLLDLLGRLPRLAARHGLESGDWGGFIERRAWLTPTAVRGLTAAAQLWEWPDAPPTQILAGILDGVRRGGDTASTQRFDALALIELRRRIGLLAEQLRGDAVTHADHAAQIAPDLASVSRLPAWIELYELNAPAVGMRRLFKGATTVTRLLHGAYAEPPAVTGDPKPAEGLQIANDIGYGTFRRRISFDITCAVEGQEHPQVILRCNGLRQGEYNIVRDAVLRLRGGDLSSTGSSLGERLLNTDVAQHEGLRGHLRLALEEFGAQAIQCMVLAGIRQPIKIAAPWHEHLADQLHYEKPPVGDAVFPDLGEVTEQLRASVRPERQIETVQPEIHHQ